ncbi:hypothetical protein PsYK624_157300 [Phanerochaete sordida]|uniref:F-box domain-containing protein n=1 Tax=Phanerochaete sordida TaxID=48140 RepID=A0A9P3GRE9_9APHY|nr:hypothetical protein PsYK624_157300 [Phanerochaete sordida]
MLGKTIHDVPQEILDRIISCLCWEDEALKACALTHRAWTRASQKYLHDSQTFNWQDGEVPVPEQYSNPEIASMVRSMFLAEPPSPTYDPEAWALLARFPRVTELRISCAEWYSTAEDRDRMHAAFGQVTSLSLSGCTWQHGHDLVYFLSAFPNVTDLEISDSSLPSARCMDLASYPRQKIDTIPGSALRTLSISWDDSTSDFDEVDMHELVGPWLAHFPSVVPEGLRFKWSSSHRWSAFPACIRAIGPVLDRLDVSFLDNDPAPADFGLDQCTQLRTISIGCICYKSPFDKHRHPAPDYSWVPRMLSQVRSPHIHTVHLGLSVRKLPDLERLDFKHVDTILCGARFARAVVILSFPPFVFRVSENPENVRFLSQAFAGLETVCSQGRIAAMVEGYPLSTALLFPSL